MIDDANIRVLYKRINLSFYFFKKSKPPQNSYTQQKAAAYQQTVQANQTTAF
jgi:hypothetical protein